MDSKYQKVFRGERRCGGAGERGGGGGRVDIFTRINSLIWILPLQKISNHV